MIDKEQKTLSIGESNANMEGIDNRKLENYKQILGFNSKIYVSDHGIIRSTEARVYLPN